MVGGASTRRGRAQNISNLLAFEMIEDQGESAQGTHLALKDPNKFCFFAAKAKDSKGKQTEPFLTSQLIFLPLSSMRKV